VTLRGCNLQQFAGRGDCDIGVSVGGVETIIANAYYTFESFKDLAFVQGLNIMRHFFFAMSPESEAAYFNTRQIMQLPGIVLWTVKKLVPAERPLSMTNIILH